MKTRPRVSDWLGVGEPGQRQKPGFTDRLTRDTVIDAPSSVANYEYLLGALRSRAPGQWSANLLELSRHFTSGVFLAVNTLCNQAASAEMQIMEKTYDPSVGDLELPHTDPACELFHNPNNDDDWSDVSYSLAQQIGLTGIGLQWMPPDLESGDDTPKEMYVIPTASALPWPPSPIYPHGSYLIQPYYPYGPFSTIPSYQSAAGARIPAEQIVRIKNQHPILRYDGYAVLTAIARQVDTVEGIDLSRFNVQQRGVDPSIAVSFDPSILNPNTTDLVRLRQQLEAVAAGPNNAGKIFFNPVGSSIEKLSTSPSEMSWQEGWEQLMSFNLACYGVPKGVAGLADESSFAGLFAKMKQFHIISLCPLLNKIAGKETKHVLRPHFGRDLYQKLTPERIDDKELQEKQIATAIQAKNILRVNEVRKMWNLPPLEGPEGEAFVGKEEAEKMGAEAEQHGLMQPKGGKEPKPGDASEMDAKKPRNISGAGSLGPRKSMGADRLAGLLDNAKRNGTAHAINGYDDGASEFLRRR